MSSSSNSPIPPFKSLPLHPDHPPFSAWALHGPESELEILGRLKSSTTLNAAQSEIWTGEKISLNAPLDDLGQTTLIDRAPVHIHLGKNVPRTASNDFSIHNCHSTREWDGLHLSAYQKEQKSYNGVIVNEVVSKSVNGKQTVESTMNNIDKLAEKGTVGRAILLDYERWCRHFNVQFNPVPSSGLKPMSIPLAHLKSTLEHQKTEIKRGDVLVVRVGFTKHYATLSNSERLTLSCTTKVGGEHQKRRSWAGRS